MKIIEHKARDMRSGETVLDRGTRFIIKEVRVSAEHGPIALIDMEGVWHGVYHPDEYLEKEVLDGSEIDAVVRAFGANGGDPFTPSSAAAIA